MLLLSQHIWLTQQSFGLTVSWYPVGQQCFSLIFFIWPAFNKEPMAAPSDAKRGMNLFTLLVVKIPGFQFANLFNS